MSLKLGKKFLLILILLASISLSVAKKNVNAGMDPVSNKRNVILNTKPTPEPNQSFTPYPNNNIQSFNPELHLIMVIMIIVIFVIILFGLWLNIIRFKLKPK